MWDKKFRNTIFSLTYQKLFWSQYFNLENTLEVLVKEFYSPEDEVNFVDFRDQSSKILESLDEYLAGFETVLIEHLSSFDKTYPLMKALLFTALLEDKLIDAEFDRKKLMSKYIHLTQEMVGGKNPTVVNAVLGTIFGVARATKEDGEESKGLEVNSN